MLHGQKRVLADTSVWIDHFRRGNETFRQLLDEGEVLMHPFVLVELACGNFRNRAELLALFRELPLSLVAGDDEVSSMIEQRRLMGRGVGYVDVHLLAAAGLTPFTRFWTLDRRLAATAAELGVG